MRKLIPAAAAVAVAALALTACSGGGGTSEPAATGEIKGEITLQTWSLTPKFQPYLDKVIKGFEAKYPGTKVKLLDQPGDGYSDKIVSQASTDSLPDVVNIPPDYGVALAKSGALLDISSVQKDLDKTYVAGALDAFKYRGLDGVYGLPWYLNTDISYWNATQMTAAGLDPKKLPTTVDEQIAQAKIMHDASGGKNFLMSSKPAVGDFARAGVPILNEDGTKTAFSTDAAVQLLQKYVDAYKAGYYPSSVLNDDYLGNSQLFTKGQVAFSTGGGPAYKDFVRDNPSLAKSIVMGPALNDQPPLYVQGLAIAKKSKNQATALAFANWILNPENQLEFANLTNTFPSTTASASDPSLSKSDGTPAGDAKVLAFNSLQKAKVLSPIEFNDAMNKILNQQVSLAMKGDVPAKKALDDAASQIDKLLANQ
ncbi:ABC transporter substrate-binding protein [Psychromicrobium lacuslunae]|uniref:Sugar ABC transporter substrate-binding protein n=1 Tax=Psychromicrobium lacuslunae TaxID=1618207 RepID=A0A0D4BZK7_9MICC|nr:sugar ABC transporter substrate-binding protein [Psychromicrobium lacuslunae]AJT41749.1 sugar ABC transporter substrate-binding protein [Psychromicrobium lacuslunae]